MRETRREKVPMTTEVTTSVKCDRCGKEMLVGEHHKAGTSFSLGFGYGSRFDLDEWSIDCCDDCAEWLRGEFKTAEVESGL